MSATLPAMDGVLAVVAAWIAIGLAGIAALRNTRVVARILFALSAIATRA